MVFLKAKKTTSQLIFLKHLFSNCFSSSILCQLELSVIILTCYLSFLVLSLVSSCSNLTLIKFYPFSNQFRQKKLQVFWVLINTINIDLELTLGDLINFFKFVFGCFIMPQEGSLEYQDWLRVQVVLNCVMRRKSEGATLCCRGAKLVRWN